MIMMKMGTKIAMVALVGGVMAVTAASTMAVAADQAASAAKVVVSRFSEVVNVAKAGGAAKPMRVEIKDLSLVHAPDGVKIPAAGFYIVQLRSGEIDTEVGGKKEHHVAGDFWTVAAGEAMTVSFPPRSESAQLHTIAITPGRGK
jgi:hypothetical protein